MLISTILYYDLKAARSWQPSNLDVLQAFEVSADNLGSLSSLAERIYGLRNGQFCVALDLTVTDAEGKPLLFDQLVEACLTFSFHYKYLASRFLVPFLLVKAGTATIAEYGPLIRQRFLAQGFAGVDYQLFSDHPSLMENNEGRLHFLSPDEDSAGHYGLLLKNDVNADDFLLVRIKDQAEAGVVLNELRDAEALFQSQFPRLYRVLQQSRELSESRKKLDFSISLLQEKLDSEMSYRSYYDSRESGSMKKIREIADWYDKEYEILPLWYKRFGHVIKVLTGKRTFKSLLNDNVKKYSD